MILFTLLLSGTVFSFTATALRLNSDEDDDAAVRAVTQDQFTALEDKINKILQTVTNLDTNLKVLQEKANGWEIFRHHIESSNEYIKSLEHNVDIIKKSRQNIPIVENKLNSLEFTVNHILSKVDQINQRSHEISPVMEERLNNIYQIVYNRERADGYDKRDILNKLGSILKAITSLEMISTSYRESRYGRNDNRSVNPTLSGLNEDATDLLKDIQSRIDDFAAENMNNNDIKTLITDNKNTIVYIEEILETIRTIDDRTIRLFDAEAAHSKKVITICSNISRNREENSTTKNIDLLRKKIEFLINSVESVKECGGTEESTTSTLPNTSERPTNDQEVTTVIDDNLRGCEMLSSRNDGIYKFGKSTNGSPKRDFSQRYCVFPTIGPGWTVIQQRGLHIPHENFNRSWSDYKIGFGDLRREFWYGNDFIHRLISNDEYELRIELIDFNDKMEYAEYAQFSIDNEANNYRLHLMGHTGSILDSMLYHNNIDFSTFDRKNDHSIQSCCTCAGSYGAGWWFNDCIEANLNGIYRSKPLGHNFIGIIWENWHGDYSLKSTKMMIRPFASYVSNLPKPAASFDDSSVPEDP